MRAARFSPGPGRSVTLSGHSLAASVPTPWVLPSPTQMFDFSGHPLPWHAFSFMSSSGLSFSLLSSPFRKLTDGNAP